MKRIITNLILLSLLLSACDKSEIIELDLEGTLKGDIYLYDEQGNQLVDRENISIIIDGSDPLISTTTDIDGYYEINKIPTGTYNIIVSKEGYGDYQSQGFKIVGGDNPVYLNAAIYEKSNTTIENLGLEIVNNNQIYVTGIVNHNYEIDSWTYYNPKILLVIHNEDDPSDTNYIQADIFSFNDESGSEMYNRLYLSNNTFPSGSKIYVKAYGCSNYYYYYYDILTNQYRYTALGTGSNIASITIP